MGGSPFAFVLPLQGEELRSVFTCSWGVAPRLCCVSPSDWKGQSYATDRALPPGYVVSVLRTGKANHTRQIGRCPQAMLFQSFGLKGTATFGRSGVASRLCCFSPLDWKGQSYATDRALPPGYVVSVLRTERHSHVRQIGRCPQAMLCQSFGLNGPLSVTPDHIV